MQHTMPAHNSEYPATLRSAQIGSRWSPTSGTRETLWASVKNDTADNLLHKDRKRKMKIVHAQNNTFASPDTQADASACKRAVFLPTHQRI